MNKYFGIEEEVINDYGLNNSQVEDIYLYWKLRETNPNGRINFSLKDKKDILETLYGKNIYTEKEIEKINQVLWKEQHTEVYLLDDFDNKIFPNKNYIIETEKVVEQPIIKNNSSIYLDIIISVLWIILFIWGIYLFIIKPHNKNLT